MRNRCSLLATSAASLVALWALLLAPVPLAGQTYLPGQPPSGTGIVSETERIPEPRSRTYLGIRERVNLQMVSYSDIDIYVDQEGMEYEVWDYLGPVEWFLEGEGELYANGSTAFYIAPDNDNPAYGTGEIVRIVVHDSGTMGIDPTCSAELEFAIYEPCGAVAVHAADQEIGTPGGSEQSMGVLSSFYFQTLPNFVNFYNAQLREKIEPQAFSWPNGTQYLAPQQYPQAYTSQFQVQEMGDSPNWYGDLVSTGGPWSVDRLIDSVSHVHVNCQFSVVQLLQFYGSFSWNTYASPTHLRKFSAQTFGAQVEWDGVPGGEKGPYNEQGL